MRYKFDSRNDITYYAYFRLQIRELNKLIRMPEWADLIFYLFKGKQITF